MLRGRLGEEGQGVDITFVIGPGVEPERATFDWQRGVPPVAALRSWAGFFLTIL